MERLKAEIEASPYLAEYNRDAVKKILKGEWRGTNTWAVLAKDSGFDEAYFRDIYGYLCGYSHASYASAMQVGQALSLDDQRMLAGACIGVGAVLMAHFARAYVTLFPGAKPILEADQAALGIVDTWGFSAEDWSAVTTEQE